MKHMKKLITSIFLLSVISAIGISQKYAFVDTEYILNNIPAYKAAQDQLDQISAEWEKEIGYMYANVEKFYK